MRDSVWIGRQVSFYKLNSFFTSRWYHSLGDTHSLSGLVISNYDKSWPCINPNDSPIALSEQIWCVALKSWVLGISYWSTCCMQRTIQSIFTKETCQMLFLQLQILIILRTHEKGSPCSKITWYARSRPMMELLNPWQVYRMN